MGQVIQAHPGRLEDYTARTAPTIQPALDAIDGYRRALARFEAAPNELGAPDLHDHSGELTRIVEELSVLDELPAVFAEALRVLDEGVDPTTGTLSTADVNRFNALVAVRVADPDATTDEVVEQADALLAAAESGDSDALDRLREAGGAALIAVRVLDQLNSGGESFNQVLRTTVNSSRHLGALGRLALLQRRLKTAADFLDERRLPRRVRREMMRAHNRPITRAIRSQYRTVGSTGSSLRANRPITTVASRFPRVSGARARAAASWDPSASGCRHGTSGTMPVGATGVASPPTPPPSAVARCCCSAVVPSPSPPARCSWQDR